MDLAGCGEQARSMVSLLSFTLIIRPAYRIADRLHKYISLIEGISVIFGKISPKFYPPAKFGEIDSRSGENGYPNCIRSPKIQKVTIEIAIDLQKNRHLAGGVTT
jgi:hypothetical protein